MNKKVKWIFSFLFFLPMSLLVIQFIIFNYSTIYALSGNSYKYDHGCWVKNEPEIVILGSSMARHGIVPDVITKANDLPSEQVVNLAMNASTPFQNFITVKRNINVIRSAKIIYYTLDPWVFSEYYYKNSFYERNFWTYKQYKIFSEKEGVANNYFFPIKLFMKNFTFRCNVSNSKNNGYLPKRAWREVELDNSVYDDVFQYNSVFSLSDKQFYYLKNLKDIVERNGSQFVFILTPKHQSWNSYYNKHSGFNDAFLKKFRYNMGDVKIIGSFTPDLYNLNNLDFSDSTHLSDSGAQKFTAILFGNISNHLKLKNKSLKPLQSY